MKHTVRMMMAYLLLTLGVGLCAAMYVPPMQTVMLIVFAGLLALGVLVVGGMFTLGVERFLFDIVPSFVNKRLRRIPLVFGWMSILFLPIVAILLIIQQPESRHLWLLVTLGLAGLAAVIFFLLEAPCMDRYLLWIERLTYHVTPLSNLYLALDRQAAFYHAAPSLRALCHAEFA